MFTTELIKNCIAEDRFAQKKLYKLLAGRLFACCCRYTRNRHEAEDWLQEGFVKIFLNIHTFKSEGSFEGWAHRIVTNHILSELRKTRKVGSFEDLDFVSEAHESQESPQSSILLEELVRFINMLPEGKKIIFNLNIIEGYSHKEIAEQLNITESASRAQLSKARDLLIEIHKRHNSIDAKIY